MKKDSLRIKEKILIVGETGTQKTLTCCEIARAVSREGGRVLYVDTEYGCERYFNEMDEADIENIDLVVPRTFSGLVWIIKYLAVGNDTYPVEKIMEKGWLEFSTVEEIKPYDLVIFDPFDPVKEARLEAKEKFLEQGYYYIGEKKVTIDNKDTFALRGYMYQIPNEWVDEIYRFMVRSPYHFIHVVLLPNEKIEEYYGWYDAIFRFLKIGEDFEAKIIKLRGKATASSIKTEKLREKLIEKFVELVRR